MERIVEAYQDLARYAEGAVHWLPREIAERCPPPDIQLSMLPRETELLRELGDELHRRTRPVRDSDE